MTEIFKDFEISEQSFPAVLAEAAKLDALHYAETETKYRAQPLQPNYPRMAKAADAGQVAYFVAKHTGTGAIVGHVFYFVSYSTHCDGLNANEDRYYIAQEHRGSGLARRLLRYAEKCLKERGVTDIFMSSKSPLGGPRIDVFFVEEGYTHIANVFHKAV